MKLAGKFLEYEYGSIDAILNSNSKLEEEAKELGIKIVKAVLEGKKIDLNYPNSKFLCSECELKECKQYCNDELERFKYCTYPLYTPESLNKEIAKKYIIAYLYSKIAISKLNNSLRKKFATREARRYREMLEKEDIEFIKIVGLDFGIKFKVVDGKFRVNIVDYLRNAVKIKDDEWKLVNRKVENGFVELTKKEFVRLIEELLKTRLEEKVELNMDLRVDIEINRREYDAEIKNIGTVDVECFPPCMKKIISDLKNGLNVPHSARFAIAAFLLNIGVEIDKIVELFKTAPDFDEDKTRYQVEHIAGMRGKGVQYICPSCDTMKSYGNCNGNCDVKHPIIFYRRCLKKKKKKEISKVK
ncbi:MAG TPA: hypothetical protein EYH04_01635 [Archaeoglobus profundus]|nr:hypothetical protein [Archaeoglobus profundus]